MKNFIVIYGGPKTMHLARIRTGEQLLKRIEANIIITGTKKERKRAKSRLDNKSVIEISATNTIEEVASLISFAEKEEIDMNNFIHVSQDFHLQRIKKIWNLFDIKLSANQRLSTEEELGKDHFLNIIWKSDPATEKILEKEPRWNKGLNSKYWKYWLIPIAKSNISQKYWKRAKEKTDVKLNRQEVKKTKRLIIK